MFFGTSSKFIKVWLINELTWTFLLILTPRGTIIGICKLWCYLVIFLVYPNLSLILALEIEFLMIRSIWKEFLAKLPVHFGNSVTVRTAKSKISSKCVLHFLGYSKLKSYIIKTQNYKINDFLLLFVSFVVESNRFSGLLYITYSTTHQRWVEVQFGKYEKKYFAGVIYV